MIPTSWDKVTLENFYPFARTLEEKPKTELEDFDLLVKRACFLTDLEPEDVMNMQVDELNKVNDLIQTPYPTKINKYIKIDGHLYRPILDPTKEDAWRYKAIMNECRNKESDNLHRILYLCCRPVKSVLNNKEIKIPAHEVEARMEGFKQLPISVANPIVVFFCNLSNNLTESILLYSEQMMTKMTKTMEEQIDSLENTDG